MGYYSIRLNNNIHFGDIRPCLLVTLLLDKQPGYRQTNRYGQEDQLIISALTSIILLQKKISVNDTFTNSMPKLKVI